MKYAELKTQVFHPFNTFSVSIIKPPFQMFPIITSASNIHQNVAVSWYGLKNKAVSKRVFHSE
jgi:hypothetical protein